MYNVLYLVRILLREIFLWIQQCFICRPSDSKDAGIEPQDICDFGIGCQEAVTTRLDLIHMVKTSVTMDLKTQNKKNL